MFKRTLKTRHCVLDVFSPTFTIIQRKSKGGVSPDNSEALLIIERFRTVPYGPVPTENDLTPSQLQTTKCER